MRVAMIRSSSSSARLVLKFSLMNLAMKGPCQVSAGGSLFDIIIIGTF